MGNFWTYLSVTLLMIVGLLMIFIILLQRGRGGGLAGAFGGAGGQSALGTKAGDVFTRITIGLVVIWVLLACVSIYAVRAGAEGRVQLGSAASSEGEASAGKTPEPGTGPALTGNASDDNATDTKETGGPALGGASTPMPTGEKPAAPAEQPASGGTP